MDLAEYMTLDPETRRATWEGMSGEEQADLKAQKAAGGGVATPTAPAPEETPQVAAEAVNAVAQSLGATVGKHLRQALTKAAAATGLTADEVAQKLMEGEDLGDMGVEMTSTLKAAVNRLRSTRKPMPQPEQPAAPAPEQQMVMPQQQMAMPQQQMAAPPQQASDLISLLGGA